MPFYDDVKTLVDRARATDIIYLDFCKTFDAVLHDILVAKFVFRMLVFPHSPPPVSHMCITQNQFFNRRIDSRQGTE